MSNRLKTLGVAYAGALSLLASSITPLSAHAAEGDHDCDAILNTMNDLHLSEESILVEVGEFYEIEVEDLLEAIKEEQEKCVAQNVEN